MIIDGRVDGFVPDFGIWNDAFFGWRANEKMKRPLGSEPNDVSQKRNHLNEPGKH